MPPGFKVLVFEFPERSQGGHCVGTKQHFWSQYHYSLVPAWIFQDPDGDVILVDHVEGFIEAAKGYRIHWILF